MICTPIGMPCAGHTGTVTTGSPMKEMGWVKMPRCRGRQDQIGFLKQLHHFRLIPAPKFLRLHIPIAGQHGAGNEPVPHFGI